MATINAVAVGNGFYQGARIRKGQAFTFEGEKLPKWAKAADDKALAEALREPVLGDTKPVATQKAVKAKRDAISDIA